MLSKVTVEMDHDKNSPYFRALEAMDSDDLRDKTFTRFRDLLAHKSEYCKVVFHGGGTIPGNAQWFNEWRIYPLTPKELEKEAYAMLDLVNAMQAIHDNSDALRDFLSSQGIKWESAGSFTLIPRNVDLFLLGKSFANFKGVNS